MRRILPDTNIYGRIIEKFDEEIIKNTIERGFLKGSFVIYGFEVIRKELRATPSNISHKGQKIRTMLLSTYDFIINDRSFQNTGFINNIAGQYFKVYKALGGLETEFEIKNDFLIVACASIHSLDIIYSEDNKTMLNKISIKSYEIVNKLNDLKTPKFENYSSFIKEIRRLST